MKKILIILVSLVLVSCEEKIEPKQCWEINPTCVYTRESSVYFGLDKTGEDSVYFCDLTESEIKSKVAEYQLVTKNRKASCSFTYRAVN